LTPRVMVVVGRVCMVDRYAPLNERQLAVLRWIADGCPEG